MVMGARAELGTDGRHPNPPLLICISQIHFSGIFFLTASAAERAAVSSALCPVDGVELHRRPFCVLCLFVRLGLTPASPQSLLGASCTLLFTISRGQCGLADSATRRSSLFDRNGCSRSKVVNKAIVQIQKLEKCLHLHGDNKQTCLMAPDLAPCCADT